ncbi:MAG TPA: hypothetical protein VMG61_14920 [Usitatibacter sp.]|nr:hypothetical protein [Usitatibacter sp.]
MVTRSFAAAFVTLALTACATGSANTSRWEMEGGGGTPSAFLSDNDSCGAEASRRAPTVLADQSPASVVAPRNTMNTPPRQDANPIRQRAYMDCMAARGWRVVTD